MSEHIQVAMEADRVVVIVDDWELFDYVGDFLSETHSLDYDFMSQRTREGREHFVMHFLPGVPLERLREVIGQIPRDEINRIWAINNAE